MGIFPYVLLPIRFIGGGKSILFPMTERLLRFYTYSFNKTMKKLFVLVVLATMVGSTMFAQSVKREGNTFVEVKSDKVSLKNDSLTTLKYKTKDGKEYPIYLSKNGKAFIVRVSKKSGREYKQYLPQVTEELNKK